MGGRLKSRILFFGLTTFNVLNAFGFTEIGKVDTVITSRKMATVVSSTSLEQNVKSLFVGSRDKNCEAQILKNNSGTISIDISTCDSIEIISGTPVYQIAGIDNQEEQPNTQEIAPAEVDRVHRFGIGVRFNSKLSYRDIEFTSGATSQKEDMEISNSNVPLVLEWNFSATEKDSWGWSAGVGYTSFKWDTANIGGTKTATVGSTSILTPYFNLIYRWEKLYIPFGLNISALSHSDPSLFMDSNRGTIGVQLGIGYILSDHITLLLESKAYGFHSRSITILTTTMEQSLGFSSGLNLMLLFNF